jgi:hypothetical protein
MTPGEKFTANEKGGQRTRAVVAFTKADWARYYFTLKASAASRWKSQFGYYFPPYPSATLGPHSRRSLNGF